MMKTRKKSWKRIQKRKVSVEELNELSIVGGNDEIQNLDVLFLTLSFRLF